VFRLPRLSIVKVIIILAAIAVGYFVFTAAGEALMSHNLTEEEQRLRDQIQTLTDQQEDLQALRDYLQTNEYIEAMARRALGLVRQGETLFVVGSDAATPGPTAVTEEDATARPWWERLLNP
jgi:cell division protein FtsB